MESTEKAGGHDPSASQRPWWCAALAFSVCCLVFAAAWPDRSERGLRRGLGMALPLALLAIQYAAWRLLQRGTAPRRTTIWLCFVLMAGSALAMPAFHSTDTYAYAQVGRLQTTFDSNPYVHLPGEVPGFAADPYHTTTWQDTPCVYGPVFALVARGTVALAGDDAARARWLFRLWNVFLLGLLVAWLLRWHGDGFAGRSAAWLLASSPLLLLHFVGNGHNDLFMAVPLVGAFLALRAGRTVLVLPLLAVATLAKFVSLLALPFLVVALVRRQGAKRMLVSLGAAIAAGLLLAAPYLDEFAAFRFDEIRAVLGRPASSLVANVLLIAGPHGTSTVPTVPLLWQLAQVVLITCLVAWQLRGPSSRGNNPGLAGTTTVLVVALALLSPTWAPWYLGLLLPLALALPAGAPVRRFTWALGLSWTLAFSPIGRIRDFDWLLMTLPICLWAWWQHRQSGQDATRTAN